MNDSDAPAEWQRPRPIRTVNDNVVAICLHNFRLLLLFSFWNLNFEERISLRLMNELRNAEMATLDMAFFLFVFVLFFSMKLDQVSFWIVYDLTS